jgi:hypothetical protein
VSKIIYNIRTFPKTVKMGLEKLKIYKFGWDSVVYVEEDYSSQFRNY